MIGMKGEKGLNLFFLVFLLLIGAIFIIGVLRSMNVRRVDVRNAKDPVAEADRLLRDSEHPPMFDISPAQLDDMRKRKDVQLIDVRMPAEHKSLTPVPGSISVPMHTVKNNLKKIDRDKNVVLICLTGHRSLVAGKTLLKNGYPRVFNLVGGVSAYRARPAKEK